MATLWPSLHVQRKAQRFPDVAADYVTRSWTRNLGMLATPCAPSPPADRCTSTTPTSPRSNLTWLVVAAPLNRLTLQAGAHPYSADELQALATQGVTTFLSRYGPEDTGPR
ncbi:MAG TPA: hypothetical protein VIU87_19470 [Mycobacterium sp.]